MNTPVTRTKILVPRRRPDLLSRTRLLVLLDDLLDYKMTLIAAPAGYGKTSLLVDLAHQVDYPVCWYALDPLDADLHRFILHFILSIQYKFPNFGESSLAILQSAQQVGIDLAHLVTTIVNDVYENISEHFAVVLDDYHLVDTNEEINLFVSRFGQEMDENCHLIIASRTLMSLPDLPLLVGRSQAIGLSFEELAFQSHEIKALLEQNYNQLISDDEAKELVNESEGWITGLLLSAETMWQGMADRIRVARVSGISLYDYLAQQVLDQQPSDVRDFLLRSSLMEEFDVELCQAVFGDATPAKSWSEMIATVLHSNLFVQPLENGGTWLRYHHLFRDFLQDQITKENPQDEELTLQKLVSIYGEREEWQKAYAICERLDDKEITADLVHKAGSSLAGNGQFKLLAKWLSALPATVLHSRPYLLALYGAVISIVGDLQNGLTLLNKAEVTLQEQNDMEALARLLTWRATTYRLLGNSQASLTDALTAQTIINGTESMSAIRAEALRTKGLALYEIGQAKQAVKALDESIALYTMLKDTDKAAYVQVDIGYVHMGTGDYNKALPHFHHALGIFRKSNDLIQLANVLNNLGVLSHLEGDLLQAEAYFSEALTCASKSGYARIEAYALAGLGDIYIDLDTPEAALELYQKAKQIAQRVDEQFLVIYLSLAEAKIARLNKQQKLAQDALDFVAIFVQNTQSCYEKGLWELEKGCLSLNNEEISEAIAAFQEALAIFKIGGQRLEIVRTQIYLAFAAYITDEKDEISAQLTAASQLVAELTSLHPLLAVSRETMSMLKDFKGVPIAEKFSAQVLQHIKDFEQERPRLRRQLRERNAQVAFSPPELAIYALGQAEVYINGENITKPEWTNQKAVRELFFFLLDYPEGLAKEMIGDALWPNSEPSQFQKQFNNTIYRLRRALGKDAVLLDPRSSRYQFNWKMDYQYDVERFQKRIENTQSIKFLDDKIIAFQEATKLYRGVYIPEIDGLWAIPIREYLHRTFVKTTQIIAEYYFDKADYDTAIEYCQRLLAEDPCQEAAHRIVMRVHLIRGNRAEVSRQYDRCLRSLQQLDMHPSPETVALFEQLMNK